MALTGAGTEDEEAPVRVGGLWASAEPGQVPRLTQPLWAHHSPITHSTHLGPLSPPAGCKPEVPGGQAGSAVQAEVGPVLAAGAGRRVGPGVPLSLLLPPPTELASDS